MKALTISGFGSSVFFAKNLSLLPYLSIVSSASPMFLRFNTALSVSSKYGWAGVKVDRAGFEPAASALRTRRSYRADLPALGRLFEMN